jgi:integrase
MKTEIISSTGRPRLRIQLDSSRILSRQTPHSPAAPTKKERRKLKTLNFGNVAIPYGHYKSGKISYWQLFYRNGSKRIVESRVSFAKLKARAETIATAIANGQIAMSQFTEADRARWRACCDLAAKVNIPPELLVSEAVEARLKAAAAKHFRKTVPDVVTEYLAEKDKELKRKKWFRFLSLMLNRFSEYYTGQIDELKAHDLNTWLKSLPGGLTYRSHHRNAAAQLCRYAQGQNYLPRDWNEFSLVTNPEREDVEIKTWNANQITELLAHTHENMIPFTVLQVFAGIRHEEINPEEFELAKIPLDWSHFDWDEKLICIPKAVAKTGQERIIPMSDNLVAWLQPMAKHSGRLCSVRNTVNALSRAKLRAKLPAGKSDSRNILRKTFISARLAIVKSIGQVAEEAGNSPAKIKSNYRKPMPESMAKRIFNIRPTSADILQTRFAI